MFETKGFFMEMIDEEMFKKLFSVGSVKLCDVRIYANGRAYIHYALTIGDTGLICTKRGQPKGYRVETCLQFLRSVGLAAFRVDMALWAAEQAPLI